MQLYPVPCCKVNRQRQARQVKPLATLNGFKHQSVKVPEVSNVAMQFTAVCVIRTLTATCPCDQVFLCELEDLGECMTTEK